MRVMHHPVEDGIAKRGVPDARVPVFDRQLTGDQRGPTADTILDQFEQIAAFAVAERGRAPVVQDRPVLARVSISFPYEPSARACTRSSLSSRGRPT